MKTPIATTSGLLFLFTSSLSAQGIYYTWQDSFLGNHGLAPAGDVDVDGVEDFLIGDGGFAGYGPISHVRVRSGADGTVLLDVASVTPHDGLGRSVRSLGDVDLDGRPDFAAGAPNTSTASIPGLTPRVLAFSGANGALLWQVATPDPALALGGTLAILGDIDSDGFPDLAAGAPSTVATKLGQVLILSGRTGSVLQAITQVPGSTPYLGSIVADAGDFDLDGRGDVLVADPALNSALPQRVTLHSGASGALLQTFQAPTTSVYFGGSLANAGDIDGDTVDDVLIGDPYEPVIPQSVFFTGRVRLYSGASAMLLSTLDPHQLGTIRYGSQLATYRDLDGDGLRDFLIAEGAVHAGCCLTHMGSLVVRSSSTGSELLRMPGQSRPFALVPDADGDGSEDFLLAGLSAPPSSIGPFANALMLTSLQPPAWEVACPAKQTSAGAWPFIGWTGAPSLTLGPDLTVDVSLAMGNSVGVLAWSLQSTALPFGGGTLCVAPRIHRTTARPTGGSAGNANGAFSHTFIKAQLAALGYAPGMQFHVQGWFRDPGFAPPDAIGLTSSITATVWP